MPTPSPKPSVLVLDRAGIEPGRTVDRPGRTPPSVAGPGSSPDRRRTASPDSVFRGPALAVLAAWSVLEGYRWIGVIAAGGSRPWAVIFAVVAVIGAVALTRTDGRSVRTGVQRLVVAAAGAVVLATAIALWNHGGWSTLVLGIVDLLLASTALLALLAGERSRRRVDVAA